MKTSQLLYIILSLSLLVILFFFFKPKAQTPQMPEQIPQQQQSSPAAQPESGVKTFDLVVEDKKLISGPEIIKVTEGDQVEITITANEQEEFHIHGYDEFVDLLPGQKAKLSFKADKTGRFIFELEISKTDLGALEVAPR